MQIKQRNRDRTCRAPTSTLKISSQTADYTSSAYRSLDTTGQLQFDRMAAVRLLRNNDRRAFVLRNAPARIFQYNKYRDKTQFETKSLILHMDVQRAACTRPGHQCQVRSFVPTLKVPTPIRFMPEWDVLVLVLRPWWGHCTPRTFDTWAGRWLGHLAWSMVQYRALRPQFET